MNTHNGMPQIRKLALRFLYCLLHLTSCNALPLEITADIFVLLNQLRKLSMKTL